MSLEAELWLGSIDRRFGEGRGTPALCVQYADCPDCKAPAGELCRFKTGSCLGHHYLRASAYVELYRAGKVPSPTNSLAFRFKELERRVMAVEAELKKKSRKAKGQ